MIFPKCTEWHVHEGIADQNRRNRFLGHIIQYGSKRPYNYIGDHLPMLKHNTTIPKHTLSQMQQRKSPSKRVEQASK